MMYYIDRPATCKAANKKWAEVQEYVGQFKNCLIADDLSRDAIIQEIRHKVEELNAAYPRTKRLKVAFDYNDFISCAPEESHVDEYVFIINLHPVRKSYRFTEKANILKGGGHNG